MPKHPPPHHRHVPSSAIASFLDRDRIDALLAPWVPDADERRFVVRCLLEEGPAHHRGANYILLALLGEVVGEVSGEKTRPAGREETISVPMRLPPHLAEERDEDDGEFPLRFPKSPLLRLAKEGTREFEAMVDCLTDGPPQHSLANAAMVCLLSSLLARKAGG